MAPPLLSALFAIPALEENPHSKKEDYSALLFALKDVVAADNKKPRLLKGIWHRIVFKDEASVEPWHEVPRQGSPAEEAAKEKEVNMLLDGNFHELRKKRVLLFCACLVHALCGPSFRILPCGMGNIFPSSPHT